MPQKPFIVIACKVFQDLFEKYLPAEKVEQVTYLDSGLHVTPVKLQAAIQSQLDSLAQPSRVLLGYGLCGNGLKDLQAGVHTLLIPKVDDCIAVLLGSYQSYQEQFQSEPATYWLYKGWLESGSNPLSEYRQYVEKYGDKEAGWLMDMQYRHYKRLALVAQSPEELQTYHVKAQDVINYCKRWDMRFEEILGTDRYIKRMISALFSKNSVDDDILMIPTGKMVHQSDFFR